MNLTFEAVRKIVDIGSKIVELKSKIECDFVVQILENYFPSSQKDKVDHCVCFQISDGHAKMKGLFIKTLNPILVQLQEKDPLQQFPIIKIKQFRILGRLASGDDFPILIIEFELLMKDVEKVIGAPISYKSYAMNGFQNPNGATSLDEHEFAGIEEIIFSEEKQVPLTFFPKQPQIPQVKQEEKQKIKISIGKSKIVKQQKDNSIEQTNQIVAQKNPYITMNEDSNSMKNPKQPQIFTKQFTNQNQQQLQQFQQKKNQLKVCVAQNQEPQSRFQKNEKNVDFFPMYQINPSFQQPFRGRVVRVNELKSYQKNQREGKMFGMTVMDEEHTVYLLFFDQVAEKFYEFLEQGKCYIFQGICVKPPKNVDSLLKMNCLPFDFSVDMNSQIIEIDDVPQIPINSFNFIKLNQIQSLNIGQMIDVVCVIKSSSGIIEFQTKHSEEKSQRISLTVYDDSLHELEITLYGQLATKYSYNNQDIYMFKSLKISEFQNRRNLMSNYQTSVHYDNNQNDTKALKAWLINFDGKLVQQISKVKLISQLLQEASKCEQDQNYKIYSEVRAKLVMIKNSGNLFYESCINCLKKAVKEIEQYFCASCNIHMDEPRLRYFLSAKIADQSGNIWISVSEEYANLILDTPANIMKQYLNEGKEKEKNDALNKFVFKEYRFKLISKLEEYNQTKRIKHTAQMIVPISNADTWQILNEVEFYMKNI